MRYGVRLAVVFALLTPAAADAATVDIEVLSNRADIVSGGDALVEVTPAGARVDVGGRDVTDRFAVRPDGRYVGLLDGLVNGANVVTARSGSGDARLTIRNHPIGGP